MEMENPSMMTLEAEINELQRENARVESQMIKLKTDISQMETHLNHGERVRAYFPTNRLVFEAEN
jgi:septal ring factor EnvC (AmiA/AmiB activator)